MYFIVCVSTKPCLILTGEWFGVPPRALFNFHPNTRPLPLELHLHGIDIHHYDSRMLAMTRPVYVAIANQAGMKGGVVMGKDGVVCLIVCASIHASGALASKPILIFVPDRKHARRVAADMVTYAAAEV